MNITANRTTPSIRYIAYDTRTGKILATHSRLSAEVNDYVSIPHEELMTLWSKDQALIADLTDRNVAHLGILEVRGETSPAARGPMMVDVGRRHLVAQPRLTLTTDKQEIVGDGEDSATIVISVVGADGKPLRHVNGPVKITTMRGRLSARGGNVELVDGTATITLTAAAETVSRVRVQATALNALWAAGYVDFEFV